MIEVKIRRKPDRDNYQLYYIDPLTGVEKTKSAKTTSPQEASRAAQRWQDELQKHGPAANASWDTFRDRFNEEYLIHRRQGTVEQYDNALDHFEKIVGHPKRMSSILPSDVSKFQAELSKSVAMQTVAKVLRHLRAALNWAEQMGMLPRAPRIAMPKLGKRRLARSRAITEAEYKQMLAACKKVRPDDAADWRRMLELLWLSGFRLDEAMRVSWDSPPIRVDLEGGQYPRVVFFAEGQKSASDELWIMPRDLAEWLRKTPESARRGPVAPVGFAGMDLSSVSHVIAHIGEAAGVRTSDKKWASAQDFRRAFGTRWARKIRKPLTLQRLMRHASVQTTMAFYVDLGEADVGAELWGDFVPPPVQIKAAREKKQKRRPSKNSQKNDV